MAERPDQDLRARSRRSRDATSADRATSAHRSILGSGSIYTLATVAPVLVSIAVTPFLTRALGADGYGVAAVGISIYQFGSIFLALGLPIVITRNAIVERSGRAGAAALVVTGALLTLVVGLVAAATTPLWASGLVGADQASVLVAPFGSAAGLAMVLLAQAYLRAVNRAVHFVAIAFLAAFLAPVVALASLPMLGATPASYLWTLAGAHLVVGALAVVSIVILVRPRFRVREMAGAFRIGLPTLPHQISTPLMSTTLVFLATTMLGQVAAGQVQLALFVGTAPMTILSALNNAWAPMVYRASPAERPRVLTESTRLVSAIVLTMMAGFVALVGPFVAFLGGPVADSRSLAGATIVAATGIIFMTVYLSNTHLVFFSGRTGLLGLTTPTGLVLAVGTVVCLLVLSPQASVLDVTVAVPIFYAALAAFSFYLRMRSGEQGGRLAPALPYLIVAALLLLAHLVWEIPGWAGWSMFAATAVIAIALEFWPYLRERRAGNQSTRRT